MRSLLSLPSAPALTAPRALPGWAVPVLLFLAAALLYTVHLDRLPHPDELYQILPAEGLLATGEPRIAEGVYTRAFAQTWLIAQSLRLFGDTLAVARLSSLLAIAATVGLLFAWLRRSAGPGAAWLGAVGFAVSPFAVQTAQFARIYGVQTFAFALVCVLTYAALVPARPLGGKAMVPWRRLPLLLLALPPFLLALHLQPTTLLGSAGLGLWAAGALGLPWLTDPTIAPRRRLLILAAALVLAVLVLAAAWTSGILPRLWAAYRDVPLFNEQNRNEFWYYHQWLSLLYPTLWPLTGVLALAALAAWPRPASLALLVFALGFLLNSFGGPKNLRYLAYALPFLFALWGMALAALWRPLAAFALGLGPRLATRLPVPWPQRLATWLVGLALLFLLVANPATVRTMALLANVTVPGEQPDPDWRAARPVLEPYLASVPVVVTTEELGTLYFLGRFDIVFSPSKLGEIEASERHEFAADPRTGRPVIGTVEALGLAMACYPEGLFLFPARQWQQEYMFPEPMRRFLIEHAEPIPLPPRARVGAYHWQHDRAAPRPAACADLPAPKGPDARVPGH